MRRVFATALAVALAFVGGAAQAQVLVGSLGELQAAQSAEERAGEQRAAERGSEAANRGAVDAGLGHLNTGMGLYDDIHDFVEAAEALNFDDLAFDPDFSPPGAPDIPVHCDVSGGDACRQCYDSAYRKINFVRHYLEKMRGIYGATRNYKDRAIAFGNSMSTIAPGVGLAWPYERKQIEDQFEKMNRTYDEKYEAYMRELLEGLQDLSACEKQYFDQDDWYNRYGFIYYTYMQDRYKR